MNDDTRRSLLGCTAVQRKAKFDRCPQLCKHEDYQPVGAFKVRGGINYLSQLPDEARARGVITASTDNHGQSIAYAARLFGVPARIVVPEGANPGKVAAIKGMGAEIIAHGSAFDEARLHCEALARREGYRYIHSANEPLLIAGVATGPLEMLEDEPDLEVLIVPIGAGAASLAAAYQLRERLKGKKVGLVCSGGNSSLAHLERALAATRASLCDTRPPARQ